MSEYKQLWWKKNIEKYGSEQAVKEHFSNAGKKGKGVKRARTELGDNPELARERGKLGAEKRWGKRSENTQ